tara:strand:+ start:3874 stop:4380 length:507 start_codon:yes stop_codon:yes gene_type:complete
MLHEKLKSLLSPVFEYYAELHKACKEVNPDSKWTLGQQRFAKYLNGIKYDIISKQTYIDYLVKGNPEDKWENNRMSLDQLEKEANDNDTFSDTLSYRQRTLETLHQDLVDLKPELDVAEDFEEKMEWDIEFNYRKQSKVHSKKAVQELVTYTRNTANSAIELAKSINI